MKDWREEHPGFSQYPLKQQIHVVCDAFDVAWSTGQQPQIEDYLRDIEASNRSRILQELLLVELEYREKMGDTPESSEYVQRFPDDAKLVDRAFESAKQKTANISMNPFEDTVVPETDGVPRTITLESAPILAAVPQSLQAFWHRLEDQKILSAAELVSCRQLVSSAFPEQVEDGVRSDSVPEASTLIKKLVDHGHLSDFQVQVLRAESVMRLLYGEYIVIDLLGEGGMGSVYLARHRRMKRSVALKVLGIDLRKDEEALERFRREVETVSRLSHPNIVAAHDANVLDDVPYYVMELVDGSDLDQHISQHGPMSASKALNCVLQTARGLEYAHNEGIIHRDIKPKNLLLDLDGTVKILDLGLARLEHLDSENEGEGLTGTDNLMGTADYMAPEQALDSRQADVRSDIYSLGCTLFFVVTGEPLFAQENFMEKLLAHREEQPRSLREVCPAVTPELDAVYQRMLAKEPDDRWQSMSELVVALESCEASLPLDHSGLTSRSSGHFLQRKAWSSLFLPAAVLLIAAMIIGMIWVGYRGFFALLQPEGLVVLAMKDSDKSGISVMLDGERVGGVNKGSGVEVIPVPADGKEHMLEIRRDGSKPFSQAVVFSSSETRIVDVDLPRADLPANFAVKFDGPESYVKFPSLTLEGLTDVTIEFTIDMGPSTSGGILNAWNGKNSGYGFGISNSTEWFCYVGDTGSNTKSRRQDNHANIRVKRKQLGDHKHHLAMVVTGSVQSFFIDGELKGRQILESPNFGKSPLTLNKSSFDGTLDELRVSRVARYDGDFVPASHFVEDEYTVALYHFDEGTGERVADASGNQHDGQLINTQWVQMADVGSDGDITSIIRSRHAESAVVPGWVQSTQYNNAIQFDGEGDFLEVPTLSLSDMRPFTFETWINLDEPTQTGTLFSCACTVRDPPQGLKVAIEEGHIVSTLHSADADLKAFTSETRTDSLIPVQEDVHVAFCFDGDFQYLHLNGQLVDSRRVLGSRPAMTSFFMGADNAGDPNSLRPSAFLAGRIDEVRISRGRRYSASFEPQQLLESDSATLALFHFDEGFGDVAYDRSGNGNHAKVTNAQWIRRIDGNPIRGPLLARAPFDAKQALALQNSWAQFLGVPAEFENSVGMGFRLIPAGQYSIGSAASERHWALNQHPEFRVHYENEHPLSDVLIETPFYMAETELTQSQFKKIMFSNPSGWARTGSRSSSLNATNTDHYPVDAISWEKTVEFCNSLTLKEMGEQGKIVESTGIDLDRFLQYRTPLTSEWEVAARGGTTTRFPFGDTPTEINLHAWSKLNGGDNPHPVAQLKANPFGIYDLLGNSSETCFFVPSPDFPQNETNFPGWGNIARLIHRGGHFSDRFVSDLRPSVIEIDNRGFAFWRGIRIVLPINSESLPLIQMVSETTNLLNLARSGNTKDALSVLEELEQRPQPSPAIREQMSRAYALISARTDQQNSLPDASTMQTLQRRAIENLEWLADRRYIASTDLDHSDFAALQKSARYLLLKERTNKTGNGTSQSRGPRIEEHHWREVGMEYPTANRQASREQLALPTRYAPIAFAVIARLNDDNEKFEAGCSDCVSQKLDTSLLAVVADNASTNAREELVKLTELHNRDSNTAHLARIACLHYRLGEWDLAIKAAEESLEGPWSGRVTNHLVVAMAMHRKGSASAARDYLTDTMLAFDSGNVGPWGGLHVVDTVTIAALRREAEELIFGHSDSHDIDEIMSLARAGEAAKSLERLEGFEERVNTLSPRLRYYMARSYAQCWNYLRTSPDLDDDERNQIRDRAIELLEDLRQKKQLDPKTAHLAIDFRPLADESIFQEFCVRLHAGRNVEMTQFAAMEICSSLDESVDSLTRRSRELECIQMLENLADHGLIRANDLSNPTFSPLARNPRFMLLTQRLETTKAYLIKQHEIRERHWRRLANEFVGANPSTDSLALSRDSNSHNSYVLGAIASLAGDAAEFDRICKVMAADQPSSPELTIAAESVHADHRAMLADVKQQAESSPSSWLLSRVACLHYRLEEWDEAIQLANESLSMEPNWADGAMNDVIISMAMYKTGETDEAKNHLLQTIQEIDLDFLRHDQKMHFRNLLRLANLRREAEDLIFGHSDSRELDEIMSQAREGEVTDAIQRLKPFEARIKTLSARFRYYMARSYTQCWSHIREDQNSPETEQNRLRDRAIELLKQLRSEGNLDHETAHVAIDFRPLIEESIFQEFCRSLSPAFDAAMTKAAVADVLTQLRQEPDPAAREQMIGSAFNLLEDLADQGLLLAKELSSEHYRVLESGLYGSPADQARFLLLKQRLQVTNRWSVGQHAFREGHHEELAKKSLTQGNTWQTRTTQTQPSQVDLILAGNALLLNNEQGFTTVAERVVAEDPLQQQSSSWQMAVISSSKLFDRRKILETLDARIAEKVSQRHYLYHKKGFLHYRLGEYESAIQAANESLALIKWPEWQALNRILIAMAEFQLGDLQGSKTQLNAALAELDESLHPGFSQVNFFELVELPVVRREAETLILGHSDRKEMDQIMSLARAGDVLTAQSRLKPFEELIRELSPRYRYDMARIYAQCFEHLLVDPNTMQQRDVVRNKAVFLLQQLQEQGSLTNASSAHLAIDLRPLYSQPEFVALCRLLNREFDAWLSHSETLRIRDSGNHAAAGASAANQLAENPRIYPSQRIELLQILAQQVTLLLDEAAGDSGLLAERENQAIEQMMWLADRGLLAENDLVTWSTDFPWLQGKPAFEDLAERIAANRKKQHRLIGEVFPMRGVIHIQIHGGLAGEEQRSMRSPNRLNSQLDVPDAPFSVWEIAIQNQPLADDEFINNLAKDFGPLPALTSLKLQNVGITAVGVAALPKLGDSLVHLRLQNNAEVDDVALVFIGNMPQLEALDLSGTAITDAGLKHLQQLANLQTLDLRETTVSDSGLQWLEETLPNCLVTH